MKSKKGIQKFKKSDVQGFDASEIAIFLDNFQKMIGGRDEKTKAISVRVPENVLEAFKFKATRSKLKYQSVLVDLMRDWIKGTKS